MRVLIIEDDRSIAAFIKKGLKEAGYSPEHCSDGKEGYNLLSSGAFDAAVVDIMLPSMDGLSIIESARKEGVKTPIIILSAKREVDDRVLGFKKGGDDYLTKPFSFSELLVRLQALLRRSGGENRETRLSCADLTMDLLAHQVERGGKRIELQPKEYSLLEYLLRNKGQVLSKTLIMEAVWDYHFDPQTNIVDVVVSRLRNKIDKNFEPKLLHTVRGVGYVIRE